MTEQELVEALARRLAHVTYANPRYPDAVYDDDWAMYVDAARECLRQMRWNYDRGFDSCCGRLCGKVDADLGLAPPDWQP
jgi:hypothetical protein